MDIDSILGRGLGVVSGRRCCDRNSWNRGKRIRYPIAKYKAVCIGFCYPPVDRHRVLCQGDVAELGESAITDDTSHRPNYVAGIGFQGYVSASVLFAAAAS